MLSKLISKDFIQLSVEVTNWQEAIRVAAMPLLKANKIKESYIDGIIESVKENGPYFLLLPQVALPHARPENGAIEDAIGITVLKTPVKMGSVDNDPVKYLFTLSAVSNTNHLSALSVLADLFEDETFFKLLDSTSSVDDVYEYISEK